MSPAPLLEVVVLHPADVGTAQEGGADRLEVRTDTEAGGRSPEPALVSSIARDTDLPVRVVLRLNDSLTTTGGELSRLIGLAEDYLAVGAEGLVFGFLDSDLLVDVEVCTALVDALPGVPWTFSDAIDASLETRRAWQQLVGLPGLTSVLTAGSSRGLAVGYEDLADRAAATPEIAPFVLAGNGLVGEHVPWLLRAGVRQFHVGRSVRPGGTYKAYVDSRHVRAWRMLLDDAADRLSGS